MVRVKEEFEVGESDVKLAQKLHNLILLLRVPSFSKGEFHVDVIYS